MGEQRSVCPMQLKEAVAALGVSKDAVRHRLRLIIIRSDKPWWSRSLSVGLGVALDEDVQAPVSSQAQHHGHVPRCYAILFHWTSSMGSVVANFYCSVGHAAENVHSGMIAYLCDLWNEGEREPFGSFLDGLGVSLETENNLRPDREWKHIDLVVHDDEDNFPVLAIEMKVDSNEARPGREPQPSLTRGFFRKAPRSCS